WLRVMKFGNEFTAYTSSDGIRWTQIAPAVALPGFPAGFLAGLAVTSGGAGQTATAAFAGATLAPWEAEPVGAGAAGSAAETAAAVALNATAGDIFGAADSFFYYYQPGADDDLDLRAKLTAWDAAGVKTAKAGLMVRASAAPGAPSITVHVTGPDRALKVKIRATAGGATATVNGPAGVALPVWLRLVKSGNAVQAFYSTD